MSGEGVVSKEAIFTCDKDKWYTPTVRVVTEGRGTIKLYKIALFEKVQGNTCVKAR